jgi:3-phosphoshikimate 1-carboxyvinyltransferase
MTALSQCGAGIEVKENTVYVEKKSLLPFHFDATHCPDLFPPLAVLAACCDGVSSITGTNRLMHKESNRALAIQQEFQTLGIEVILTENTMEIVGGKSIQGGNVWSHHDHRIAMALTILATVAENNIQIQDMHAIQKSYPTFLEDFNNMLQ